MAPIYFVDVPGIDEAGFAEQRDAWVAELARRHRFDLRPWFHAGFEALKEASVQDSMARLKARMHERIVRGERAERALGNVDRPNPRFVGRVNELE